MTQPLPATPDPLPPGASPWRKTWQSMTQPAPARVLVEQLRLVHANAALSFGATLAAAVMTAWLLHSADRSRALTVWLAAVALSCGAVIWLARWFLHSRQTHADAVRAYLLTLTLYPLYGAVWGMLPWLAPGLATPMNTIWLLCVMTSVLAGGMTFMVPLLPACSGFAVLLVLPLTLKFLLQDEAGFLLIGIGSIVMLATVLGQTVRNSGALRSMIDMRFAHEAVLVQLREETEGANQARASADAARHEAEAAHREAEAADLAKSKFLAAASHDLRQPIHALGLFLEVLASTQMTVPQVELLASARVATRASAEMLNTLLDFSRIEAGVVQPQRQPFAMQTLLYRIENDLAPLADAKSLAYRSPETAAVVESDAALVEMILRNLVSNAIRYTERGGVLIGCRRRGATLVVEVRDTGIGIAPEHQEEVFREFHQLGNPERDRRKGLGLGLAIARGLASACGHALHLASQPGRGSVFRLTLPLAQGSSLADDQAVAMGFATTPDARHANALQGIQVLVLDDDVAVCAGMSSLLRSWGCLCETAETIEAALEAARERPPAVFITDYRLRERETGLAAIEAMRATLGAELPVLLVTGDTAPERLRETSISGVPLLHKPVRPQELLQALVRIAPLATRPSLENR